MNARDTILAALRENRPKGEHPLPPIPQFIREGEDLRDAFEVAFKSMGGRLMEVRAGEDRPHTPASSEP